MGLGTIRPTALVTGAAGFLGSHLVDRLLSEGFEVVGLDNLMTGDLSNLENARREPHFHLEIGDVREPLGVYAELVFNFACPASPIHYQHDPYATLTTSVLGAQRVVEMARGRPCTIIHASTSEVYGDPLVHPQPESYWGNVNPIGDRSCYDEGKRCAETLLNDARRRWGLDTRILRLFNTYGPRMALDDGRVVSNFSVQALTNQPVTIYGDGSQSRSFCYVDDLVEGIFRAAVREPFDGPINLGNPGEFTILELAELVINLTNSRSKLIHKPSPNDDPRHRRPDISRARELLGFTPTTQLRTGLEKTVPDFLSRLKSAKQHRPETASEQPVSVGSQQPPEKLILSIQTLRQKAVMSGQAYRTGNHMNAAEGLIDFTETLNQLVPLLIENRALQNDSGGIDNLVEKIENVGQALERQDSIGIADLLEYETIPLLDNLLETLST